MESSSLPPVICDCQVINIVELSSIIDARILDFVIDLPTKDSADQAGSVCNVGQCKCLYNIFCFRWIIALEACFINLQFLTETPKCLPEVRR